MTVTACAPRPFRAPGDLGPDDAPLGPFEDACAGTRHTCGIAPGVLWCWGSDARGQLGDGPAQSHRTELVRVTEGIELFACGSNFTCFAKDQIVHCFGLNDGGQVLGDRSSEPAIAPVAVNGLPERPWVELALGFQHACARSDLGEVFCWGENAENALGPGDGPQPRRVVSEGDRDTRWRSISAGEGYTCGVTDPGGEVQCWGRNDRGQLGRDGGQHQPSPVCFLP